ncbi:Fe(3+)-siderophore ABC transporter permease [Martelella alba]|uniref:Fe(3+)-siderophore ABC transporter permease n=1 Tax=Martelella alba TaxID=2590451 RepID=A0ABY2SMI3_9HYPH|nr:Fe(3+)-siderophore ABC transporter permease [Martelella alba]TKI06122.1 Fe(3+)-siderophore ABC transporter permease [Martelella alba]
MIARYPLVKIGLLCLLLALLLALSLLVGAKNLPAATVIHALSHTCRDADCVIVLDARLPRTLAGLLAGVALGLAGSLMQTLTGNPLADPGILGVNAGAGFAMVLGTAFFGAVTATDFLWFALIGALIAAFLVTVIGAAGGGRVNPVRLTLAGIALGAVLEGVASGIALLNPLIYDSLRFWQAGSLDIRSMAAVKTAAGPILLGTLLALGLARGLNTLAMGHETAAGLGSRVGMTQIAGVAAITLLCGGATALAGPIAFIGLMMPPVARRLVGSDHRRQLPCVLLLTPSLLLAGDIAGRVMVPGELRVSVVTAFLGAPFVIILMRRHRSLQAL